MTPPDVKENTLRPETVSSHQGRIKAIQQIQKSQGDFPCFKTAHNYLCDPTKCVWRKECIPNKK